MKGFFNSVNPALAAKQRQAGDKQETGARERLTERQLKTERHWVNDGVCKRQSETQRGNEGDSNYPSDWEGARRRGREWDDE